MGDLLYFISTENQNPASAKKILNNHPEIKFVSLLGIDLGGNGTDEKIPVRLFLDNIEDFLRCGVQTDGSSVVLHEIATLNNARVDIVPDQSVKWFVDYNYNNLDSNENPIGTLRIPSFLIHNGKRVDSRSILLNAITAFQKKIYRLIDGNPEILKDMGIEDVNEIDDITLTSATELEFWVQTPDDKADIEKLSASQVLKEQYWKRTRGAVRTALEESLLLMEKYGLKPEMGHKEVGGVKSKIGNSGKYTHVMEQLEIDWKFSNALQAADNELITREIVGDTFRKYGLEVTFSAKPICGVAGSGEHTHVGVSAKLKNGKTINLFSPQNMEQSYLSIIGYGALMGLLKNYEVINPFVTSSNDAFKRLKPGFEAPVCIVTSLGHSIKTPSRNRSVLVGLVRDMDNPLGTRFEVRAPNPRSNTYLVLAAIYQGMLDGIGYAAAYKRIQSELELELSKKKGEAFGYLDPQREYRSEQDVFEHFSSEERDTLFGKPPATVWENVKNLVEFPDKLKALLEDDVFTPEVISSYKTAVTSQWVTELESRIIPSNIDTVRSCIKLHENQNIKDIDTLTWERINSLRYYLIKDSLDKRSLFSRIRDCITEKDYDKVSELQKEMNEKMSLLNELYAQYKRNLFEINE